MDRQRVELVDALRGYALFGLLIVHCVERFELYWLNPQPDAWFETVFAVFSGKAFAIFALLFGFSFATIMGNERARGGDYSRRFVWRLMLLFAVGTLHTVFYRGDILQVLAIIGLLLVPADRIRANHVLLGLALLAFAQLPLWWQAHAAQGRGRVGQCHALFLHRPRLRRNGDRQLLAGCRRESLRRQHFQMVVRLDHRAVLRDRRPVPDRHGAPAQRPVCAGRGTARDMGGDSAACGGLWLALQWAAPLIAPPTPEGAPPMPGMLRGFILGQWQALAAMGFQVAAFVLLWHLGGKAVLRWFAPPGRMTLTLYVAQSVLMVPLLYGYGAGLHDEVSNAQLTLFGLAFFAAQIAFSVLWFRHFRYGPLEWLWRAGTRTTLAIPMRREAGT